MQTPRQATASKLCAFSLLRSARYGRTKASFSIPLAIRRAADPDGSAVPAQAAVDERALGAIACEPLCKQLWRRATAAKRHQSASCRSRLGNRARVRDQRPETRRVDCFRLRDPARDLF